MKIYLYLSKKISVFYLPESISGSFSFDVDDDEVSKLINVDAKNGKWYLFETDDCKVIDGNQNVKEALLLPNHFYVISRYDVNYLIYVTAGDESEIVETYNYTNGFELVVGEGNATALYNCPFVSDVSFSIISQNGAQPVLTINSANVYANKMQVKNNYVIKSGDEIELYGVRLIFLNKLIVVMSTKNIFSINSNAAKLFPAVIHNYQDIENIDIKDKALYGEDDYFSKSPRLRRIVEEKKIELTQPPTPSTGGEMPFILTIGPMLTMAVTSIVMLTSTISNIVSGITDVKSSLAQLVSGSAMLISSILWPVLSKIYNSNVKKKNEAKTVEKYNKYLQEKEDELLAETKLQTEIIRENIISLDVCMENLKHRKLNFWDKRIDQNDFLVARIGVGDEKLKVEINEPKKGFSVEDSEIKEKVYALLDKYRYIKNVPIGYSFYENSITAIMGTAEKSHNFINNILFQLLTFYSYDDLKIVVFTNEENKSYWDYVKYMNHNMSNDGSFRFFASNEESASIIIDILNQEIASRTAQAGGDGSSQLFKPYYFIIVDDLDTIRKDNIVEKISEVRTNIGFSSVILERKLSRLPSLCNNFISLGDTTSGVLRNSYEEQEQQLFTDEINPNINMMEVAKVLSNIPVDIPSGDGVSGDLPDAITFLEMAKVGKVEQLNILNRWNTNDSTTNLKAEVGVDPDGKLMYLDLHEKAHGPHGLIAGMTGSGKSEFIITWILSLCMNFSPDDVAFILIDYKGGGLAFAFENQATGIRLPHLTGTITNLDKAEIDRTLVSIDSEVKRRQKIFNEARDKMGESTIDIYKYQGFYHEGKLDEPLPHLFIVCDEFAELKAQQPDFMDNLISVARIGRSLGVHLILATQKPSGVVNDQIWSNTKFRVCLKVQDASDSNEMLKKPDAASLKQTGRFYLQVGYDEYFALGQSGWCGAKYYPSDVIQKSVDKSVNIIDETGIIIKNIQASNNSAKKVEAEGEQLAAIMKEIINVATQSNRFAKRLWLENIPPVILVDEISKKYDIQYGNGKFNILLGEYDAPEKQEQFPLMYDFVENGNTLFISRDSEESEEMLNTVLYGIMKNYKPEEISYFIIDYGSQNFVKHKKSPHCGGVVTPSDSEEYANLIKLINDEKKERKKILSEFGSSYSDYVKANPGKMPIMMIAFYNYESIMDTNKDLYDTIGELVRDSDRYGIVYFITTNGINAMPERHRQLIPFTLAFKLKEASDYGFCFSVNQKKEPKGVFGRGICKDETLHEFQTAFVCEERSDVSKKFIEMFDQLNKQNLKHCIKIPSLPEQIMLEDVESKLKGLNKIPVGIEKGNLAIRTIDLTTDIGKLVISTKHKYLNSFVRSFVTEIKYLKANIVLIDPMEYLVDMKDQLKNYFSTDLEAKLDKLIEFVGGQNSSSAKNVIIINSMSRLIGQLPDNSKIGTLIDKCKAAGNTYIFIADEVVKLKDMAYDPWYKSVDVSEGIYIGPGVDEQSLLKISNYTRELSVALPKNFGYYIAEGAFKVIKLIEFEREAESDDEE